MNKSFQFLNLPMKFILFGIMISLNLISLMTSNLIHLWFLLEINLLIFLFLMTKTTKYFSLMPFFFFIQAISSLMIIWIFNLNFFSMNYSVIEFIFFLSISMKLGLFPFTWLPPIFFKYMNWNMIFLFSTLQKFIPFMIIKNFNFNCKFLFYICLYSIILSTFKAIFTENIKSIMAYSSINNSAWMIIIILIDTMMFQLYFLFYLILMFLMKNFFNQMNMSYMSDILIYENSNMLMYFILMIFSLSMIPPFCSFIPKISGILILIKMNMLMMTLILTICSILSILMYLTIMIKLLLYFHLKYKIKYFLKTQYNYISLFMISFMFPTFWFMYYLLI
uniref:NADH-ubiquinone oxidoreductase chain 2 n=1 Tax=Rhynchium quinquecinctum TaxID=1508445 RepID=A0A6M9ATL8_9HYME|nr:NADH dehydrogenase subunit 2 [Rhynchium quinquecinctum]